MASLQERFWAKVDVRGADDCWEWTAGRHFEGGYGRISLNGRMFYAHRVSWELHNGEMPDGLDCLHTCDNPPCVNPAHLFLGTQMDNMADRDAKGRLPDFRGEANNSSKLTEAQVIEIKRRYAAGDVTQKQLGEEFGVVRSMVGKIVLGKKWSHVREGLS